MKIYTVGSLVLSPYTEQLGKQAPEKGSLVVCSAFDLTADVISCAAGCRLCVVGCPDAETAAKLPENAFVVPYYNRFGSLQFLFEKLTSKAVEQKGIFRFVKCGKLADRKSCIAETKTRFASVLFLLEKAIGGIKTQYGKVFEGEDYLRFNAIVTMENGTIFFFEEKYSSNVVPSEYWEYAFNDGIMVSDSYRELPLLCISSDGGKRLLDGFRITGNLEKVASVLEDCGITIADYRSDKATADVSDAVGKCF